MKAGRNDPCPCGSGKKYKKCHGKNPVAKPPPASQPPIKAELPIAGMSGHMQWIASVPRFSDPLDPRNQGGPQGLPGKYRVTFTLHRPGFPVLPEYKCTSADYLP